MNKRILIVEDDPDISSLIELHLLDFGAEVIRIEDGIEALQVGLNEVFDMIILDVMLPNKDGLEILKELRASGITTPVLMLTARSEEIDKVLGLELGSDDYMTKPFSVRELIARVKAIFRRTDADRNSAETENDQILNFGKLEINLEKRKVTLRNERIDLTPKEFDLLALMASHPGTSYSREKLLSLVWGYEFTGYEHTVNSHINRLRTKIERDLSSPEFILTTWGIGYRFNDDLKKEINEI